MKFGGTSVADLDKIANAAKKVVQEVGNGHDVIVIVSAMSGKTNELVNWVKETKEKNTLPSISEKQPQTLLKQVFSINDDTNSSSKTYLMKELLVGTIGFEPTTPSMSPRCSNQLSYAPKV